MRAPDRGESRTAIARALRLDPAGAWLAVVAMMRADQKLLSYRALAAALGRLPDLSWQLVITGAGPAEPEVRAAFSPLGDRVRIAGMLDRAVLRQLYRAADLYVWPAVKEAWGMALLEAQAAGLPVVAGRSPGVAAIVADGRTGLLVPAEDEAAFAAAVRALLADRDRLRRMGAAAMQRTAEVHDIAVAADYLDRRLRALRAAA
jgi:glycosyltransferase involved in cell wall biosynthesis